MEEKKNIIIIIIIIIIIFLFLKIIKYDYFFGCLVFLFEIFVKYNYFFAILLAVPFAYLQSIGAKYVSFHSSSSLLAWFIPYPDVNVFVGILT